jgi:hypothetical protein
MASAAARSCPTRAGACSRSATARSCKSFQVDRFDFVVGVGVGVVVALGVISLGGIGRRVGELILLGELIVRSALDCLQQLLQAVSNRAGIGEVVIVSQGVQHGAAAPSLSGCDETLGLPRVHSL